MQLYISHTLIDPKALSHSRCIRKAVDWLHVAQRPEGGWYGSWGICFTYATQFALESLSLVGETYTTSEASRRACEFLIEKQREDGGWGESWEEETALVKRLKRPRRFWVGLYSSGLKSSCAKDMLELGDEGVWLVFWILV